MEHHFHVVFFAMSLCVLYRFLSYHRWAFISADDFSVSRSVLAPWCAYARSRRKKQTWYLPFCQTPRLKTCPKGVAGLVRKKSFSSTSVILSVEKKTAIIPLFTQKWRTRSCLEKRLETWLLFWPLTCCPIRAIHVVAKLVVLDWSRDSYPSCSKILGEDSWISYLDSTVWSRDFLSGAGKLSSNPLLAAQQRCSPLLKASHPLCSTLLLFMENVSASTSFLLETVLSALLQMIGKNLVPAAM